MRNIQLRSINDIMALEEAELEETIANFRHNARERQRQIELNFQAAALLDGAGVDLEIPEWTRLYHLHVELGDKPYLKKQWRERDQFVKKLNTIRHALGCPLKFHAKQASPDGKRVLVTLAPTAYPHVRIRYAEKLRRGSKCKVVTRCYKSKELVCEV